MIRLPGERKFSSIPGKKSRSWRGLIRKERSNKGWQRSKNRNKKLCRSKKRWRRKRRQRKSRRRRLYPRKPKLSHNSLNPSSNHWFKICLPIIKNRRLRKMMKVVLRVTAQMIPYFMRWSSWRITWKSSNYSILQAKSNSKTSKTTSCPKRVKVPSPFIWGRLPALFTGNVARRFTKVALKVVLRIKVRWTRFIRVRTHCCSKMVPSNCTTSSKSSAWTS